MQHFLCSVTGLGGPAGNTRAWSRSTRSACMGPALGPVGPATHQSRIGHCPSHRVASSQSFASRVTSSAVSSSPVRISWEGAVQPFGTEAHPRRGGSRAVHRPNLFTAQAAARSAEGCLSTAHPHGRLCPSPPSDAGLAFWLGCIPRITTRAENECVDGLGATDTRGWSSFRKRD